MNGPRVGLCTFRFPKSAETWAVTKFVGLVDAGLDAHVFCLWEGGHWDRFGVFAGRPDLRERVHFMPDPYGRRWTAGTVLCVARRFAEVARRHPADLLRFVVHNWRWRHRTTLGFWRGLHRRLPFVGQRIDVLHLELDTLAPEFADMKVYLGCRLVLSGRSTLQFTGRPEEWPGGYASLFDLADAYHVETTYTRDNLHHLGLDPAVPIWIIRSSVDARGLFRPDPARQLRSADDPLRVLTVSRLAIAKGIEFALAAVATVQAMGIPVRYTIVGEGDYHVALRAAARQLGLVDAGIVEFLGGVAREDMVERYREADVVLHASTDEGLPNVPLEAQAMELPVVATAAAGTPDAVEDGVTAILVPPRDSDALADALVLLAVDPALRRRMGEAGRRRILEGFDLGSWIPQYVDRYRELAGISVPEDRSPESTV